MQQLFDNALIVVGENLGRANKQQHTGTIYNISYLVIYIRMNTVHTGQVASTPTSYRILARDGINLTPGK